MDTIARRIGVLIPPANFVCETEYPYAVPKDISFHFNRLQRPESTLSAESLVAMKTSAADAARGLAYAGVSAIAYACTSASFLPGAGSHDSVAASLQAALSIPAVTTSTAVLEALARLGSQRPFVVTPYPTHIAEHTNEFLRANHIDPVASFTFNCADSSGIASVSASAIANVIRRETGGRDGIDAVLISCTNLRSLGYLEALENELGIPVVSSNSATVWAAVRLLDADLPLPALGRLGLS